MCSCDPGLPSNRSCPDVACEVERYTSEKGDGRGGGDGGDGEGGGEGRGGLILTLYDPWQIENALRGNGVWLTGIFENLRPPRFLHSCLFFLLFGPSWEKSHPMNNQRRGYDFSYFTIICILAGNCIFSHLLQISLQKCSILASWWNWSFVFKLDEKIQNKQTKVLSRL